MMNMKLLEVVTLPSIYQIPWRGVVRMPVTPPLPPIITPLTLPDVCVYSPAPRAHRHGGVPPVERLPRGGGVSLREAGVR